MKKLIQKNKRFLKYILVGSVAFLSEYMAFSFLYLLLHTNTYIANSVSFIIGLSVSFTLNRGWTFGEVDYKHSKGVQALFYLTLAGINLVLTNILIYILSTAGLAPLLSKLITMGLIVCWNYILFKKVIFTNAEKPN